MRRRDRGFMHTENTGQRVQLAPLPRAVLVAGAGSSRETDEDLALHSHPPVTKSKEHSPDCPSSHSVPSVRKRNWRSSRQRQGTLGLHLDLVRFCLIKYLSRRCILACTAFD